MYMHNQRVTNNSIQSKSKCFSNFPWLDPSSLFSLWWQFHSKISPFVFKCQPLDSFVLFNLVASLSVYYNDQFLGFNSLSVVLPLGKDLHWFAFRHFVHIFILVSVLTLGSSLNCPGSISLCVALYYSGLSKPKVRTHPPLHQTNSHFSIF